MPHYLKDGQREHRWLKIDKTALTQYQTYFGMMATKTIPMLFFARYWPEFDLFKTLSHEALYLTETVVTETQPLMYDEWIEATLEIKTIRKIKQFERYQFELQLPKQNRITQIFVKWVK